MMTIKAEPAFIALPMYGQQMAAAAKNSRRFVIRETGTLGAPNGF
jgi:hypothetical protein